MRLENYIMEQDINTASVADIFVEQAEAELNVAMSLLEATSKDLTFQEFAVYQEGELGDAVSAARAEVREDGKKHHIKAALAAIKAFFKFLITKVGAFFKKTETDAAVVEKNLKNLSAVCSQERGEQCDVKLPYTKEQFGKIVGFYDGLGAEIEEIVHTANALTSYACSKIGTDNDSQISSGDFIKRMKSIENFIAKAQDAANVTKVESAEYNKAKQDALNELGRRFAAGDKNLTAEDRKRFKQLKKQAAANAKKGVEEAAKNEEATKNPKPDLSVLSEIGSDKDLPPKVETIQKEVLVEKAGENETFIGWREYSKFRSALDSAKKAWNSNQKYIEADIKRLDKKAAHNEALTGALDQVRPAIKKLQSAVVLMITPADEIVSKCKKLTVAAATKSGVIRNFGKSGSFLSTQADYEKAAELEAGGNQQWAGLTRSYLNNVKTPNVGIGDQSSIGKRTQAYKDKQAGMSAYERQFNTEYYNYEDNYGSVYDALM